MTDEEEPIYVRLGRELKEARAHNAKLSLQVLDLLTEKNEIKAVLTRTLASSQTMECDLLEKNAVAQRRVADLNAALEATQLEVMQLRAVIQQYVIDPKYRPGVASRQAMQFSETVGFDCAAPDSDCGVIVEGEVLGPGRVRLADPRLVYPVGGDLPPGSILVVRIPGPPYGCTDISLAGSVRMVAREHDRFLAAGGKIHLNGYEIEIVTGDEI